MNLRMIFYSLGKTSLALAALLVLPMITSAVTQDGCVWAFVFTIGIAVAIGVALMLIFKPRHTAMFSREGFVLVSLVWIYFSLVGALPFVISGAIPNYIDAFFETVSGVTTTGASILTGDQIEAFPKGLLFWRSFTHWVGGMGIIVFVMVFATGSQDRSMHILRAEMPGPTVDKLVPRVRDTAKMLYLIYIGMTALLVVLLLCGGMPFFDSLLHAFGTAGTGGFGVKADSIASYSPYCQWVITIFMLLFGVNFNVYCLMALKRFKTAVKSQEVMLYLGIVVVSIGTVTANLFGTLGYTQNFGDALRHASFQTVSFMTTTGYTTIPGYTNINFWPELSKWILLLLMFVGGCAGSTAGGLKVSRIAILGSGVKREIRRLLHPRNANVVKFEGKVVTNETLYNVFSYFVVYVFIMICIFVILCFDPNPKLDFVSKITATAACFNNIGPAYGEVVGGYFVYSQFSKVVLSIAMLLGRLEIFPLLLFVNPSTWKKQ